MDDKIFWDIIAAGCPHDVEDPMDWHETLVAELIKLPPEQIVAFDHSFDEKTDAAYRRDLWSAAALINGFASDDGFYYFRCWLVGMGKKVYEAALADPDSLAEVVDPARDYEAEIYGVARGAWSEKGGSDDDYERAYQALGKRKP